MMKTKFTSILLAWLLWAVPMGAQALGPNVGPVNCLVSWPPVTLLADNVTPIPAGSVVTYKIYMLTTLSPGPIRGTTAPVWTGTTTSADCNLPGWTPGFTVTGLAMTATPPGQLYAWATASLAGGAESALSDPFPFMWLLVAPLPPSVPPVPAKVTGLTVK